MFFSCLLFSFRFVYFLLLCVSFWCRVPFKPGFETPQRSTSWKFGSVFMFAFAILYVFGFVFVFIAVSVLLIATVVVIVFVFTFAFDLLIVSMFAFQFVFAEKHEVSKTIASLSSLHEIPSTGCLSRLKLNTFIKLCLTSLWSNKSISFSFLGKLHLRAKNVRKSNSYVTNCKVKDYARFLE